MRSMKLIYLFASILFVSFSLANPFLVNTNQRDFQEQQNNKNKEYFTKQVIQVPTNARELETISVTFQNIDGALETKELHIDKTIDWHYPLTLTQEGAMRNIQRRYFSLNDFEFLMEGSTLMISSPRHNIVRHFLLPSPQSIIIDFSRNNGSVYSGKLGMGEKFFNEILVESKSDIYRVSIRLDGTYKYTLKKGKNSIYTIDLK